MNNYNIAFEISDAHEHHAHIVSLVYIFSKDSTFNITLYSIDQKHIDAFYILYAQLYSEFNDFNLKIISAGITHRVKHSFIKFFKRFKLTFLIKELRSSYGYIRGKSSSVEGGNDFYLKNMQFFKSQKIIFTTELKGGSTLRCLGIKIVFCLHGIISNDNPFFKNWHCDLVISPSRGLYNKLRQKSNFPKEALVYSQAYLKKEVINKLSHNKEGLLFKKNQFTFLYNPHWDNSQGQSSWETFGNTILEFFYNNSQYNLIFAPHILLDKYFGLTFDNKYRHANNIYIDISSSKLCNGFYIPFTNCYIGDVSSQYFEFLLCNKKIQSIFINASLMNWEVLENYDYWNSGDVVNSYEELVKTIHLKAIEEKIVNNDKLHTQLFSDIPENQIDPLKTFITEHIL